jgi:hypothetical protein
MKKCKDCGGSGKGGEYIPCNKCDGKGYIGKRTGAERKEPKCNLCNDKGRINDGLGDRTCPQCSGTSIPNIGLRIPDNQFSTMGKAGESRPKSIKQMAKDFCETCGCDDTHGWSRTGTIEDGRCVKVVCNICGYRGAFGCGETYNETLDNMARNYIMAEKKCNKLREALQEYVDNYDGRCQNYSMENEWVERFKKALEDK